MFTEYNRHNPLLIENFDKIDNFNKNKTIDYDYCIDAELYQKIKSYIGDGIFGSPLWIEIDKKLCQLSPHGENGEIVIYCDFLAGLYFWGHLYPKTGA